MADSPADVRKRLAAKNAKLADARTAQMVAEAKGADELEVAHLLAEEARVDAELSAATDAAKPANVKAGYKSTLDAATAAMEGYGLDPEKAAAKLPKDGSTVEKPVGITPEGEVIGLYGDDSEAAAEKAGSAKGGAR